ncbi:MAG: 30S ribosome-binding factor RbfA [Bacillota bacterium]|jgi:ribosome-binding factor A
MGSLRPSRVAEEIKKEVSVIIQREVKDPRVGFVTVTGVEVTNDLRYAKIYVSVFGGNEEEERSLAALNKAKGLVRSEVGKRIRLRVAPEITFIIDKSLDRGARINELISQVKGEKEE